MLSNLALNGVPRSKARSVRWHLPTAEKIEHSQMEQVLENGKQTLSLALSYAMKLTVEHLMKLSVTSRHWTRDAADRELLRVCAAQVKWTGRCHLAASPCGSVRVSRVPIETCGLRCAERMFFKLARCLERG